MKKAKEIVIISGKGGTGKTTITSSLAEIMPRKVIVDTDVDAANLHILLKPENICGTDFQGMPVAFIDEEKCALCGRCRELCRFHAVDEVGGKYIVDEYGCEGCGLCEVACPAKAIEMKDRIVGKWFRSSTAYGPFLYARLIPGAENSGRLVSMVKAQAKKEAETTGIDLLLVDGPPGIGCPVISAVSGSDLGIIVTEPTMSGISDLERVHRLLKHFNIRQGIVINRFDINLNNTARIEAFAEKRGIPIYGKIPHLSCIMTEISESRIPIGNCPDLASEVRKIYDALSRDIIN